MARILVGTVKGLHRLGDSEEVELEGREVTSLTDGWVLLDGQSIMRSDGDGWQEVASLESRRATCLGPTPHGVLVGTSEAHLLHLSGGDLERVDAFEDVDGRDEWYTPWGGPPDVRSLAHDAAGALYVNVHVGGIVRSRDGGRSWQPTIDIHHDVHQVLTHPDRAGLVFAAAAVGLARSDDGGDTWTVEREGLHATYSRAVAVVGDSVLLSASTGPGGRQSAIYRRPLDGGSFERCRGGLPEWFSSNVDTGCLAADGAIAVFGTRDGMVYLSEDSGRTWEVAAAGLPEVTCVSLA